MNRRSFLQTLGLLAVPAIVPASTKLIFDLAANKNQYEENEFEGYEGYEEFIIHDYDATLYTIWTCRLYIANPCPQIVMYSDELC